MLFSLVYSVCFCKTVHNKCCLDRAVGQIKNGLERGFVKHWPNGFGDLVSSESFA